MKTSLSWKIKYAWKRRRYIPEAAWELLRARLLIQVRSFQKIAPTLGTWVRGDEKPSATVAPDAGDAGWAVRAVAKRVPWKATCLVQAMAVQRMLKRRGISGMMVFGVFSDSDKIDSLSAHAWVACGDQILVGKRGHRKFTVVSAFVW